LTLVYNTGIAFGLFKGMGRILILIAIAICFFVFLKSRKEFDTYLKNSRLPQSKIIANKIAVGFILGGAISNVIDRLRFGYVIDFLDFRVWPVFNFADSFITIGAAILIFNLVLTSLK